MDNMNKGSINAGGGKGKIVFVVMGIILGIIGGLIVFFNIPYSRTRTEFAELRDRLVNEASYVKGVFTENDIAHLPLPVQKYFFYCGYIGTPKMSYMKAVYKDVDFLFGKDKSPIKIDYTQYNFSDKPSRLAYIDSRMFGIPFEGLDICISGRGLMKGVMGKLFPLFEQTGEVMDKASLVSYLSECLIIPNAALQVYISWEEIDDLNAMAALSYKDISVKGVFSFKENGEMESFTSHDREAVSTKGRREKAKWSVVYSGYEEKDGIKRPTVFKAIWHYDEGDLVYFKGENVEVIF